MAARRTSALPLLLVLLIGSPARNLAFGAPEGGEAPTRGVLLPGAGVAGEADATGVETNPGQLGLLDAASSALVLDHWGGAVRRGGRGAAFLLAGPTLVPRLTSSVGVHWLRPSGPGAPGNYYKLQLAPGLRLSRALGVGLSWEHLFGGAYDGVDSFTFGVGLRLHPTVALGVALRDLNRPRIPSQGRRLEREWDVELAVRPLRDDRLEIAPGVRLARAEEDPVVVPRLRVAARLARGAALFAEFHHARERLFTTETTARRDHRATLGLVLDFDRSSVSLAGLATVRDWETAPPGADDRAVQPGGGLILRSYFARRPPLVASPYVARVKLSGLEGDRAFVDAALRLARFAADEKVGAVVLQIDGLDVGLGRVEELRGIVETLRARGKPVLAYLTNPSTRELYLAAACDRIAIHPAGGLFLVGLSQSITFYKGLMDQLGVNLDLVRIAEYKGAMEPFVLTQPSEPVRRNRDELLDDVAGRLFGAVARGRRLSLEATRALVDRGLFSPEEAKAKGLVDAIADDKELDRYAREALGRSWPVRDADFGRRASRQWLPARVGVLFVDGTITEGKGGGLPFATDEIAWGDRLIDAIEALRADRSVRAVVLRVNSPGGSAFASDRIARALRRLRQAGKPIVVSMGDVAASGGYYVAAPADVIFANPSTTTGSIGIYSYKIDARGLATKLGLETTVWKRGAHADLFSVFRPWTDEERELVRGRIGQLYGAFLDVVADGRKGKGITKARADELGRGRVFSGAWARREGLADELGGIAPAILEAARRGGVPRGPDGIPELAFLPAPAADPLEALLALRRFASTEAPQSPGTTAALTLLEKGGRAARRLLLPLLLGPGTGFEARLPYELELR